MCVCVCVQNISKNFHPSIHLYLFTYEWILMNSFGEVGVAQGTNRLDFGGLLDRPGCLIGFFIYYCDSYRQGCKRDLGVRDRDETETFDFQSETRPRPRPSHTLPRPRRDRDLQVLGPRRDRDRDVERPRPRRFSRRSHFGLP